MKALGKSFFTVLIFLFVFFVDNAFAVEEPSVIDVPKEFEGVQDVMDIESGAALENDIVSEEEEKTLEKNEYQNFLDSIKRIRMLDTPTDVFSASVKDSGRRFLTSFANGKYQRRFYDENLRLEKVEYWKISSSSDSNFLERLVTYNPPEPSTGVYSIFERDYSQKTESRTFYHPNGKIKSQRKNYFDKDGLLTAFEIFTCKYNSSYKALQERLQKYSVNGKKIALESDELNTTKYEGEKIAETSYYKNSILRVRTFYGEDDKFVRATYFDGGVIVRDFYKGNIKLSSSIDDGDDDEI